MSSVVDTFLELVQIDSPSGSESAIAEYIQKFLHPLGFQFQIDAVGNLLATRSGLGEPRLLCAHMDTVQPSIGVQPKIAGGQITSSGNTVLGADNKASLAAMLTAIAQSNPASTTNLELLFTVKEEVGGGVELFPTKWLKAKHGYIFDHAAPLGEIIMSSPFITNFVIEIIGKAAHSKNPEDGISSVSPMVAMIIQFLTEKKTSSLVNFGQITAGTGANIIPEKATILGEVRSFSENDFFETLSSLQAVAKHNAQKYGATVGWKTDGYCPGYQLKEASESLSLLSSVLAQVGIPSVMTKSLGVSDANILQAAGIDVIVAADGVKNPHCLNESIAIVDLEKLVQIVNILIKNEKVKKENL